MRGPVAIAPGNRLCRSFSNDAEHRQNAIGEGDRTTIQPEDAGGSSRFDRRDDAPVVWRDLDLVSLLDQQPAKIAVCHQRFVL